MPGPGAHYNPKKGKLEYAPKKKARKIPTAHEVSEHEGNVKTQPLPPGPKVRRARKKRGEPVSPKARAEAAEQRKLEGIANSTFGEGPIEKAAHAVGGAIKKVSPEVPGAAQVRHVAEDEVKSIGKAAKEHLEHLEHGQVAYSPSKNQLAAGLTVASLAAGGDGASTAEKALAKAASGGSDASSIAKLATKLREAPKAIVKDLKAAPKKKVAKLKAAPGKLRTAPKRAKQAASTPEGRKAAAKAAGKYSLKHPIKTGVPAAAALPPGANIEGFDPGQRARAFAEGTWDAATQHPKETLETTGHGVLGFLTAPLALTGSAVSSVKQGSPQPLIEEGKTLGKGTLKMGENLASGDPKKVEETTLKETGLTPFIPVPHFIKAAKGSKLYEDSIRGTVRDTVEGKRATTRDGRIAAEKAAQESGEFISRKAAKKIRKSVADTARPGEHYVLRRTGKLIEKQRSRHYVSREVARMQEEGSYAGKREAESVAKPLRKSKGTDHSQQNDSDALAVILKHGLPLDHSTLDFARRLKEGYGDVEHGDIPSGVHLDRHSVQWILDHPEMFQGKRGEKLAQSVAQFDRQSEDVGTSARHRYVAQTENIVNPIREEQGKSRILLPEERIPDSTKRLLPKREKPWSRSEALTYAKNLKDRELAKKIKQSIAGKPGEKGLMLPPEHGGAEGGISTTQADAYTPEMEREYVREAETARKELGLRKPSAYVANKVPKGLKGEEKAPNYAAELPLRKIWPSRGEAARSGNAESSFESLMHHSVESPRARRAVVNGLNRIFDKASRDVGGKRYLTEKQVEKAINTHQVPDGTIFLRTQALKSVLEGEHTADSEGFRRQLEGEIENGQAMASSGQMAEEMRGLKGAKGEKFAPMDAAAINELMGHLQPLGKVTTIAAHATNIATRTILNSPAFAAIQIPQEGLPLAAALGANIIHLPKAILNLRKIAKLPAEDQAAVKAVVGSSVGVLGAPSIKELRANGYMDPIRAAGGTPAWRHAWNLVNGNTIGKFDRTRAGVFREVAADARVQGDFRKAAKGFKVWRRGANNLFKGEQEAVEAMKGMDSRAERMAYVAAHPRLGDKLMRAMNDMAGNWNSFTVFEKHFAPLTLFYPFQRYSVLWMLYHFPLDHPVVATALTALGQVNAQELQSIAAKKGGSPSILDYTMPVVSNGPGKEKTVLPAGQRTFPGLATLQQAAVTGNPAQLVGELPPEIAIPAEAAFGKSSYSGYDIGENGWIYMLRQAANLSPLARFIGVPNLGKKQSVTSKIFEQPDPLRTDRSTLDPFIGQTGSQYGEVKALEHAENVKHGEGDVPSVYDSPLFQKLLYGHNGGPNPNPAVRKREIKEAVKKINESEAASNFLQGKEAPFYAGEKTIPKKVEAEIREAFEDAYQSGPSGKPKKKAKKIKGTGIGGSSGSGIGGGSIGGGIGGGPIGGGIGGGPIGGGIGGGSIGGGIGG